MSNSFYQPIVCLLATVLLVRLVWTTPMIVNTTSEHQESNNSSLRTADGNSTVNRTGNGSSTPEWMLRNRKRERQEQLILIQFRILNGLGIDQPPNITSNIFTKMERARIRKIFHKVLNITEKKYSANEAYVQRVQSFYPSCKSPKRALNELRTETTPPFYLHYNVNQALRTGVDVSTATLRLWQVPFDEDGNSEQASPEQHSTVHPWFGPPQTDDTDKRLRVSIYQFTRPLKRNKKVRKKLVDSRVISASRSGWQEFNVRSAVKDWLRGQQNYGFEVKVENVHGVEQNPNNVFKYVNCSDIKENNQPFPNLIDNQPSTELLLENETYLLENKSYPTLDLHTLNIGDTGLLRWTTATTSTLNDSNQGLTNTPIGGIKTETVRAKRSSEGRRKCLCELKTSEFSVEEIGLDFVIEPRKLKISFCQSIEESLSPDEQQDAVCEAIETSDVTLFFNDDDGFLQNVTIHGLNDSQCYC